MMVQLHTSALLKVLVHSKKIKNFLKESFRVYYSMCWIKQHQKDFFVNENL